MKMKTRLMALAITIAMTATTASLPVWAEDSQTELPDISCKCELLEDGTIVTSEYVLDNDLEVLLRKYSFTPDGLYTRDYDTYLNSFQQDDAPWDCFVSAKVSDADLDARNLRDRFSIQQTEDGTCCFSGLRTDSAFTHVTPDGLYAELPYLEAYDLAAELMRNRLTDAVKINQTYMEYAPSDIRLVGTFYVYADHLTEEDFSWMSDAIEIVEIDAEKASLKYVSPYDYPWKQRYSLVQSLYENIENVQGIAYEPYMYDAIYRVDGYEPVKNRSANTTGDVDNDESVTMSDAYQTLMYTSKTAMGTENPTLTTDGDTLEEACAYAAADVNCDDEITASDAYHILVHTSYEALGKDPSWTEILNS